MAFEQQDQQELDTAVKKQKLIIYMQKINHDDDLVSKLSIGRLRVPRDLCIKRKLSAQPLIIWK